jgi:hypothetical protein
VPSCFCPGLLLAFLVLTGCGIAAEDTSTESPGTHGTVFGGHEPIAGFTIQVWVTGKGTTAAAYGSGATALGTAVTTDARGTFRYGTYI